MLVKGATDALALNNGMQSVESVMPIKFNMFITINNNKSGRQTIYDQEISFSRDDSHPRRAKKKVIM